jgi:hypothetical protein
MHVNFFNRRNKKGDEMIKISEDLIVKTIIVILIVCVVLIGIDTINKKRIKADEITNQIMTVIKDIKSSEKAIENNVLQIKTDIVELDKRVNRIPEEIIADKRELEKKLQQINVFVSNKTVMATGSGATIKYKGKYYILSAGHMAENPTNILWLQENEKDICELEIVKQDYTLQTGVKDSNDLILLRPKDTTYVPRFYVELADWEPETANQLNIVGNPLGIEDVVSDARVIFYQGNYVYMIGTSYFGNSGGGIYNQEGQLVGIMSHLVPIQPFPDVPAYVIHGAVRLSTIYKFLMG